MNKGYFGLVVPAQLWWQGFFLPEVYEAEGRKLIRALRGEHERSGLLDAQEVHRPAADVKGPDQKVIGALCAALVSGAVDRRQEVIGAAGAGIRQLSGHDYFLIRGEIQAAGHATTIVYLDVDNEDAARAAIKRHPWVMAVEAQRLTQPKAAPQARSADLHGGFGTGKTRLTPKKPEGQE